MHLRVGALAQAERFYHGAIGMDPTRRRNGAAFLSSGHYHHHLGMNVWQSQGAGQRDDATTGLAWFSLVTEKQELLAAQEERLRKDGAKVTALADGVEAIDPWGTRVRLIRICSPARGLLRPSGASQFPGFTPDMSDFRGVFP